jgi:hypothetical protein
VNKVFIGIRLWVWFCFFLVIVFILTFFFNHERGKKPFTNVCSGEQQKNMWSEEKTEAKGVFAETERDLNRFGLSMSNTVRVVVNK